MSADLETRIGRAAPEPPTPDTRAIWEMGRRRHRRRATLAGAACLVGLVALVAGLSLGGRRADVTVRTDDPPTSAPATPPPPSTIATDPTGWTTFTDRDAKFTVELPPGWSATTDSLTGLTDPVERLTAASYPLDGYEVGDDDLPSCQVPLPAAIGDAGSSGAFATIMESTTATGVPDHLIGEGSFAEVPNRLDSPLCGDESVTAGSDVRWVWFGDGQRFFYLAVAVGPDAPAQVRSDLWRMLDSFTPIEDVAVEPQRVVAGSVSLEVPAGWDVATTGVFRSVEAPFEPDSDITIANLAIPSALSPRCDLPVALMEAVGDTGVFLSVRPAGHGTGYVDPLPPAETLLPTRAPESAYALCLDGPNTGLLLQSTGFLVDGRQWQIFTGAGPHTSADALAALEEAIQSIRFG